MTTVTDEQMLDQFWTTKPIRPASPPHTPIPPGAVTCTITCAVCARRVAVAVDWAGRLCGNCRADLPGSRARVEARIADAVRLLEEAGERWLAFQARQDDATADRWTRIVSDRDACAARLRRLDTGRDFDGRAEQYAELVAQRDALAEKRQRAMGRYPEIAALVEQEARYHAAERAYHAARGAAERALGEIALASGEEVPF